MLASPRRALAALLLIAAPVLSGCDGMGDTGDLDYVAGNGNVAQFELDDRQDPVEITGETLDGDQLSLADYRGDVVVVNVWADDCNPCRAEAPQLLRAAEQTDARFVGIDTGTTKENGLAFEREVGIDYPSVFDPGSDTLLRFGTNGPTQALPSTAVLDRQGRVAAVISGAVQSATTLREVIEEVAAEDG